MTPTVVSDDPIALRTEEKHLAVPSVGRKRPAVAEYNRLSSSPVLIKNFRSVFNGDHRHRFFSFVMGLSGCTECGHRDAQDRCGSAGPDQEVAPRRGDSVERVNGRHCLAPELSDDLR